MSLKQKPSGRFNKGLRKVQAAQAEARSLAIRDYSVRVRAAVDALEQKTSGRFNKGLRKVPGDDHALDLTGARRHRLR